MPLARGWSISWRDENVSPRSFLRLRQGKGARGLRAQRNDDAFSLEPDRPRSGAERSRPFGRLRNPGLSRGSASIKTNMLVSVPELSYEVRRNGAASAGEMRMRRWEKWITADNTGDHRIQ